MLIVRDAIAMQLTSVPADATQTATGQAVTVQPVPEQPAAEQQADGQPPATQTATGQAVTVQPAPEQPAAEQQADGQPPATRNTTGQAVTVQPTPEQPAAEQQADGQTPATRNTTGQAVTVQPTKAAIAPSKLDYKKELANLGFYTEDSKDAPLNLRNAILRFQSNLNMTVTGKWDSKCANALAQMLAYGYALCDDTISDPPGEDIWIVINKSKKILTLYEGAYILKKYPVALGNPQSLTPGGKFTIVNKITDPYWGGGGYAKPVKGGLPSNPLGRRWMGLSYKTGGDLGIHGNNDPYSIGKYISHGCIRMINSDVEELFEIVPITSKVWIGTDAELKTWGIVQPIFEGK